MTGHGGERCPVCDRPESPRWARGAAAVVVFLALWLLALGLVAAGVAVVENWP